MPLKTIVTVIGGLERVVDVKYAVIRGTSSSNPREIPDDPLEIRVYKVFLEEEDIMDTLEDKEIELIENILYEEYD